MHSSKLLSAVLAAGAVGVVSAATTCTKDIKVTQPTPIIACDVVDADITIDESVAGDLSIEGPKTLKGNLIINNATQLISISSSTITTIEGNFELDSLELLSSVNMQSLKTLNKLSMVKLPQLSTLTFGTSGVTKASSIQVTDTFLSDLSGLNINSVDTLTITNNNKLTSFDSDLVNITTLLSVTSNGNNMEINMTKLETAAEIQLSNVKSFVVPRLKKITQSLKFDTNPELVTFSAKNISTIGDSVTFINNKKLTNVSFPLLTSVGDLTIQNNTALGAVEGFPKLQTVAGGVILRGNFDSVELPSLKDVKGGVTVYSTTDISAFCGYFNNAKSKKVIQGQESCKSNVKAANEGGSDGDSSTSNGDGSDDDTSDDKGNNVAALNVNTILLGVSALAVIAQLW
ncbi:cell wall [Trichoderma arundinaceum]|uniref:Cell wall n=1 Tax=Trichoderma arundinaceum TaxID=490622 RepID=A0A395NJA4_TRIAR|nr:cell wall [Trichoderma arundinaceum]